MRIVTILAVALTGCASEEAQYDADCGDGWFADTAVTVDSSGAAPVIAWSSANSDAVTVDVFYQDVDPPENTWTVDGVTAASVTYGEVPAGATESVPAVALVSGGSYDVVVGFVGDDFNCGTSANFTAP
jgi:hypothetical protein